MALHAQRRRNCRDSVKAGREKASRCGARGRAGPTRLSEDGTDVGKASRAIPLFAALRPILAKAFELAPAGAVYVVDGNQCEAENTASGWRNCNLRTQFERIVKRAGLQPWPRPFHAMQASRETELAKEYPIHNCNHMIGNHAPHRLEALPASDRHRF